MIASLAVPAKANARPMQLQKKMASSSSTLMNASTAVPAQAFAPSRLRSPSNSSTTETMAAVRYVQRPFFISVIAVDRITIIIHDAGYTDFEKDS